MPWCDDCNRFWNPNSMNADGTCPTCGRSLATATGDDIRAPWHFKLLVVAVVAYLGWRAVEMLAWLVGRV